MPENGLKEAYQIWVDLAPYREYGLTTCCKGHHYGYNGPMPDDVVCARELAWRLYVRIRDDRPDWPFDHVLLRSW